MQCVSGASERSDIRRRAEDSVLTPVIGQDDVVTQLLIALLANGHVLMEGLPGLAKTRTIKTLAANMESEFRRIQFTPDLLPSDITGTEIYTGEAAGGKFVFQQGPVFGNLILADEINRAPAKAQAALLEAMEERQVTVAGTTHKLPELFVVLATQNPIEQEGTYPLPEAQMDRFLLHVFVGYSSDDDERKILRLVRGEDAGTAPATNGQIPAQSVLDARKEVLAVQISETVEKYIVALIAATRRPGEFTDSKLAQWIKVGASPRGTLALDRAARAKAWLDGRDTTTPADVQAVAHACLRHRLILSYEAEAEGVHGAYGTATSFRTSSSTVSLVSPSLLGAQLPAKAPREQEGVYASLSDLVALQFKARGFSFLPRQPMHSLLAGRHASRRRGRGLNFRNPSLPSRRRHSPDRLGAHAQDAQSCLH
jgi:MoxR-like ATPase